MTEHRDPIPDPVEAAVPDQQAMRAGPMVRLRAASGQVALDERRAEQHRVAASARLLIDRLVATEAPTATLAAVAADIESAAAHLHGFRSGLSYEFGEVANAGADPSAFFDHSPLIGKSNPLSPPLLLEQVDDRIVGQARFGAAYEGPPGCVHGGYVAAAFDELLGAAQGLGGQPGMTGTLSVRYRRPTPLLTDLAFEAHLVRIERRKTFVAGTCSAGGEVTAEAEGIFIAMDPQRFLALRLDREQRVEAERARRGPGDAPGT